VPSRRFRARFNLRRPRANDHAPRFARRRKPRARDSAARRPGPLAHLPIVAVTANVMADNRQRCLDAGMNDYIAKPIELRVLKETLEHWLSHRASLAAH